MHKPGKLSANSEEFLEQTETIIPGDHKSFI